MIRPFMCIDTFPLRAEHHHLGSKQAPRDLPSSSVQLHTLYIKKGRVMITLPRIFNGVDQYAYFS